MNGMDEGKAFERRIVFAISVVAICMVFYHILAPFYLFVGPNGHQVIHLTFALLLIFLHFMRREQKHWAGIVFAATCITLALISAIYSLPRIVWLEEFAGDPDLPFMVILVSIFLVFLVLEATRQTMGLVIPVVCLIFMAYAFFSEHMPGFLRGAPVDFHRFFIRLGIGNLGQNGIFGSVLSISANVIFLFFVYGSLLKITGGLKFFTEIGKWVGRKLAGGPGISSVITSALVGMITGTPVGNVALTGSFTIPAMKKAGYEPYQAAAIEATASTGGSLMPPIMGLVAFIMAAMTGIPYFKIALMALIPSVLYYFSAFLYVQLTAMRKRAFGSFLSITDDKVDIKEIKLGAPLFFLPLFLLIFLVIKRYSLGYSIALTNLLLLGLSLLRKETRPSVKALLEGITDGALIGSGVAAACGAIGLILGATSLTVLVQKVPLIVISLSGGSLIAALALTAVSSIILGMGVSVVVAYLVVVMVTAPALMKFGVTMEQAHMFTLYYGTIGFITPPVAAACIVAAKMAGSPFMKTAIEATKVAIAGFIVPVLFIYAPVLLMMPQSNIALGLFRLATSFILVLVLQVGICGQYLTPIKRLEKVIPFSIAIMLFLSYPFQNILLAIAGIIAFGFFTVWQVVKRNTSTQNVSV